MPITYVAFDYQIELDPCLNNKTSLWIVSKVSFYGYILLNEKEQNEIKLFLKA